jgi:FkbM family methyltransferase
LKVKELFYLLGLKPKPVRYGFVVEPHEVAGEGRIEVARWLHPNAYSAVPDPQYVRNLRHFLREGDVAIDIGAHIGDSSIPIALAVGPTGSVLAFEPNPFVFPVLRQNAALNRERTNIVPLQVAATRTDGPVVFKYSERGFCNGGIHEGTSRWVHGSAYEVTVPGRNLPELLAEQHPDLLPRLRFIKTDAEGYDLAVLETLDRIICRLRPYLQVEFFNAHKSPSDYRRRLLAFLTDNRYRVRRVQERDTRFLAEEITDANLFAWKSYDVFCIPEEAA